MTDISTPINVTVVRDDTGEICGLAQVDLKNAHLQRGNAPEGVNTYIIEGNWDPGKWYGVDGVLVPRPKLFAVEEYNLLADGMADLHFSIPAETTVIYIADGVYKNKPQQVRSVVDVDASGILFSTVTPGLYEFELRLPFPYQWQTLRINAHD